MLSALKIAGALVFAGYIILACMGGHWLVEVPLVIAGGWVFYLYRVLPQPSVSWPGVLTAAACLAGLAVGLHCLLRWLADARQTFRTWQARWTAAALGLVLLLFVAGIAALGVAH
jgi:hypothetical protein